MAKEMNPRTAMVVYVNVCEWEGGVGGVVVACYCLYKKVIWRRNMEYGFACIKSFCKKSMVFTASSREDKRIEREF